MLLTLLPEATAETIYMTFVSAVFACMVGFPLGAFLFSASPTGIHPREVSYTVLSRLVNLFRSMPVIILLILLFPLSRLIFKTDLGSTAAIIPLALGAVPLVGRMVESALSEVDPDIMTAARSMGSTDFQILWKILIPEALPELISALVLIIISLIGYSAIAGALGAGGLGSVAIQYRFRTDIPLGAMVMTVLLAGMVHLIGTTVSRTLMARRV